MKDYLTKRIEALTAGVASLEKHYADLNKALQDTRQKFLSTSGALHEAKEALAQLEAPKPDESKDA